MVCSRRGMIYIGSIDANMDKNYRIVREIMFENETLDTISGYLT